MTRARKPKNGQEIVPAGAPMGRPCEYQDTIGNEICERIAIGESLARITKDAHMPDQRTVYRWLLRDDMEDFRQRYARAREYQADTFADEVPDIADTQEQGETVTQKADGTVERRVEDMLGHRKLRIDARKWAAAHLRPKKYGPKLEVETRNRIASAPIPTDASAQEAFRIYEEFVKGE